MDEKLSPRQRAGTVLKIEIPRENLSSSRGGGKSEGTLNKIFSLFKKEKWRNQIEFQNHLHLVRKMPDNPNAHLKLAEIYKKKGDPQNAISEYLVAGEILTQKGLYPQAITLYKHVLRQAPTLDRVRFKIADIYRQKGSVEDAYSQYGWLLRHYNKQGREDKALEVMCLMAELSMQKIEAEGKGQSSHRSSNPLEKVNGPEGQNSEIKKKESNFDLNAELQAGGPVTIQDGHEVDTEKIYGFEEIINELKGMNVSSPVYPHFNFHMGVACREMGFINEAVEQFQIALEKGQSRSEAAHLLGHCYKEKGCWEEARRSFTQALKVEGVSREKIQEIKNDLALIDLEEKRKINEAEGFTPDTPAKRELELLYRSKKRTKKAGLGRRGKLPKEFST